MNNVLRFALVLFLVNLVAASILAGVYTVTKPIIEDRNRLLQEKALREVMPEDVGDRLELTEDGYWKVFRGSGYTPRGYVFIAKRYGYSSVIETMVGIKADGTITGAQVLSHNETPGLGAKIVEVVTDKTIVKALKNIFSKKKEPEKEISPYFTEQFKGMDARSLDMGDVDAITGATISSKAVVDSIREKAMEILNAR